MKKILYSFFVVTILFDVSGMNYKKNIGTTALKQVIYSSNQCAICLSDLDNSNEKIETLGCFSKEHGKKVFHKCHYYCFFLLLNKGTYNCPVCNYIIVESELIDSFKKEFLLDYPNIKKLTLIIKKYPIFAHYIMDFEENISVLHCSAERGIWRTVRLLIRFGAEIDLRDSSGETPLHKAARSGYRKTVEALCGNGANLESVDAMDRTALHYASMYGNADVVKILLRQGANKDAQSNTGNTALHYAVMYNNKLCVKALISFGANSGIVNKNGNSPFSLISGK